MYLHLKAGFAFVQAIGRLASRPEVSETLHGERWGAVTVSWHLKMEVAVVCGTENAHINIYSMGSYT